MMLFWTESDYLNLQSFLEMLCICSEVFTTWLYFVMEILNNVNDDQANPSSLDEME